MSMTSFFYDLKNLAKAQRNAKNCFFLSKLCTFARGKNIRSTDFSVIAKLLFHSEFHFPSQL